MTLKNDDLLSLIDLIKKNIRDMDKGRNILNKVVFNNETCDKCYTCIESCSENAIQLTIYQFLVIDLNQCRGYCTDGCIGVCPTNSIAVI